MKPKPVRKTSRRRRAAQIAMAFCALYLAVFVLCSWGVFGKEARVWFYGGDLARALAGVAFIALVALSNIVRPGPSPGASYGNPAGYGD